MVEKYKKYLVTICMFLQKRLNVSSRTRFWILSNYKFDLISGKMLNQVQHDIRGKWHTITKYFYAITISLILLLGVFLRIKVLLINNLFQDDECRLVLAMFEIKGLSGFFLPLTRAQSAPPLFLILSTIIGKIFGFGEYALKSIPLLSGIASIFIFYKISSEYFQKKISIILSCFLFSVLRTLILYSTIFKQYSTDLLIGLICMYYLPKININKLSKKRLILLILSLIVLPFISLTSLFFIGGFLLQNLIKNIKEKEFYKKLITIIIPFTIFLGLYYIFDLHPSQIDMNTIFPNYWDEGFCNFNICKIFPILILNLKFFFSPNTFTIFPFLLFWGGIYCCIRDKNNFSKYILAVSFFILLASFCNIYPYFIRVAIYSGSLIILFIIKPLDYFKIKSPLGIIICFMLFLGFYGYNINYVKANTGIKFYCNFSPDILVKEIKANYNPQKDIILTNNASKSSYVYYSKKNNFYTEKSYEIPQIKTENAKEEYIKFLNELPKNQSFWFYLVKDYDGEKIYSFLLSWFEENNVKLIKQDKDSYLYYLEK